MVTQLVGRAPLFDGDAHPALYRIVTRGGVVDGLVDSILSEEGRALSRGLPLLVPVSSSEVGRVAASDLASLIWAEPLEDEFTGDDLDAIFFMKRPAQVRRRPSEHVGQDHGPLAGLDPLDGFFVTK